MAAGHGDGLSLIPELNWISGGASFVFMDCFNSFIPHTKEHGIHTHSDCPNELVLFLTRFQVAAKPGGLSPGHVSAALEERPKIALW